MRKKGFFIVLEGTDGSGKATQFRYLLRNLKKAKIRYKKVDFPQYGKSSAYFVKKYLLGKYGKLKEVGPYKASLFYALDRFDISQKIRNWLNKGFFVVANRYVLSNLAYQGAKIKNNKSRKNFFEWLINLEYNLLKIPKPDLNILLYIPAEVAYKLIVKKDKRKYLKGKKRDIHERNIDYLKSTEKVYLQLARLFRKRILLINCLDKNNKLLSKKEIAEKIWNILQERYFSRSGRF